MKWGKKKGSSASSQPSLISHFFPISWLLKLKPKKGSCTEAMPKGQQDSASGSLSWSRSRVEESHICISGDDTYWRLSFGEQSQETAEKLKACRNSPCFHGDDDDHQEFYNPSSKSCQLGKKNMQHQEEIMEEYVRRKRVNEEEYKARAQRKKDAKDERLKILSPRTFIEKQSQRGAELAEQKASKAAEKLIFEVPQERLIRTNNDLWKVKAGADARNCSLSTIEEECIISKEEIKEELDKMSNHLEGIKIKAMPSEDEKRRGSIRKERNCEKKKRYQKRRSKAYSPKTLAKIECKIRALEEMKKARVRKRKAAERTEVDTMIFDSYAVVKRSLDPKRDIRESMIEMIVEKGIVRPEDLEKLLACYLTLNHDEYHGLIIEVFRRVWFELNEVYYVPELQSPHCYDEDQLFRTDIVDSRL